MAVLFISIYIISGVYRHRVCMCSLMEIELRRRLHRELALLDRCITWLNMNGPRYPLADTALIELDD